MSRRPRSVLTHAAAFLSGAFLALLASNVAHLAVHDNNYSNVVDHDEMMISARRRQQQQKQGFVASSSVGGGGWGLGASDEDEEEGGGVGGRRRKEEARSSREEGPRDGAVSAGGGGTDANANATTSGGGAMGALRDQLMRSLLDGPPRSVDDGEDDEDLCSVLPRPTPTTLSLWSSQLHRIVDATRHGMDRPEYALRDFTALLLDRMTPDRLQRSVKTLPLDWTPVERCMDVIRRRLASIRDDVDAHSVRENGRTTSPDGDVVRPPADVMARINGDPKHPRKLNVVVMGGSVTMGVVCHVNPATRETGRYSRRACAWPGRVSDFLRLLSGGYDLVDFHTLALGGTNTESGSVMWDYSLLPDGVPYPDVLINSYATNDMHYNSVQDAIAKNVTLAENLLSLGQDFVRQVLTPKGGGACDDRARGRPPPLLLYLDDYLGNEQDGVMTTMLSPQTIHLLSGYYGLGSMSYGDAVRDIKYGDTREWWFGPNWYEKEDAYGRAVHPHMGMHISMVWVVAYNLMNLVTTYCSLPPVPSSSSSPTDHRRSGRRRRGRRRHHAGAAVEGETGDGSTRDRDGHANRTIHRGAPLQSTNELVGGPRRKPRGIPPPLTPELSLEHITELWREESERNAHLWKTHDECAGGADRAINDDDDGGVPLPRPCVFSWVANLERSLDNPKRLNDKVGKYVTSNEGWGGANDNNKLGWVPLSGLGSKFTMEFKGIPRPVRAATWMIMRSYGDRWEGSMLHVEAWSGETLLARRDIEGYHDKNTSETYNIKMRLDGVGVDGDDDARKDGEGGAVTGSDLRITFELVGGSTFKISGMAICDH